MGTVRDRNPENQPTVKDPDRGSRSSEAIKCHSFPPRFDPLSQVRQTLRIRWYRSPIDSQTLRRLSQRSDLQGFLQAGGHLGLFVLSGLLVHQCWASEAWSLFLVTLFLHGTITSFFSGIAPHELGHGTVFQTKWLNRLFLYPFSLIGWFDPFAYNVSHTYHHRYTLHAEGDGEVLLPLHPMAGKGFLLQMLTLNLLTERTRTFGKGGLLPALSATLHLALGKIDRLQHPSHQWLVALREDQAEEFRKSMWFARVTLLFHGTVLMIAGWTGQWVWPLILTTAVFSANGWAYLIGMTQHCGLRDNVADFRKCVRSIRLDPFSEFLYWRMNYHTEHHMYAGVPCYRLKSLSRELEADLPERKTLVGAWQEMLEVWRRQQKDPDYQYDVPLPHASPGSFSASEDPLASSIGDLAPEALRVSGERSSTP